jgi:hypothetical protein
VIGVVLIVVLPTIAGAPVSLLAGRQYRPALLA